MDYLQEAKSLESQITAWRRDFHRHPELRFEEHHTAKEIAEALSKMGVKVLTGIGKTGLVGLIEGSQPGPVILMRFDMDALPIQEETLTPYQSEIPGKMHACGHDAHIAIGLAVGKMLVERQSKLKGTVKLAFQPAEEGAGGALAMIEDGVLENPKVNLSFGLHVQSQTPAGTLLIQPGPVLSAADTFKIIIKGKGGHGALPHETIDPIVVGSHIVTQLQTIISRNVNQLDTAILSVCGFHAGSAFNIIPETAELIGTVRTFTPETRSTVHTRMKEIIEGTAKSMGASASLEISQIVPAVVNEPEITAQIYQIAKEMIGAEKISDQQKDMPSDDVAEFLQAAPGCHFILGAGGPDYYPHHNARFDIDETALPLGAAVLTAAAIHFLS
jgi:amidohydrolase